MGGRAYLFADRFLTAGSQMARAFLFVLDSFGIGGAPDASAFGDEGADTFGHIEARCAQGGADRPGLRAGPLHVPNMRALGLGHAAALSLGRPLPAAPVSGFFGAATEISKGKDTPSGHWEIAGLPALFDWGYFPDADPALPASFTEALIARGGLPGILCNRHASGTAVIEELGEEHVRTGRPIVYTSVDSVIQIAAHETHFGLERLYELCRTARRLADPLGVCRIVARPFVGETAQTFARTPNRKDFATPPPQPTLLDRLEAEGRKVLAVGKIGDIFSHRGISSLRKASDNMAMFDAALAAIDEAGDGDFVFANFVDFDTEFGHRRDVAGYAAALEAFDARLPEALSRLAAGDMLILTADHGCDPTFRGTDHTRERVPIMGSGPGLEHGPIGLRASYADIGETVAEHLGISPGRHGASFRKELGRHA